MKAENFIKKYTLSDFFSKTINMINFTWKDSIIISAIAFLPIGLIYSYSFFLLFSGFSEMINNIYSLGEDYKKIFLLVINKFGFPYLLVLCTIYLYYFIYSFANACISLKTFKTAFKEKISLSQSIKTVFTQKIVKIIIQYFILNFIITGFVFIYLLLLFSIIGIIVYFFMNSPAILAIYLIISIFASYLAFIIFLIWFSIASSFSQHAIIYENCGSFEGIGKSFSLIKKNWWRVFGISFLISIIISFSIGILTGPIIFIFILPVYIDLLKNIFNTNNYANYLSTFYKYFSKIAYIFGINLWISGVVYTIVYPVYRTLFYIDLKIRKGEIQEQPDEIIEQKELKQDMHKPGDNIL